MAAVAGTAPRQWDELNTGASATRRQTQPDPWVTRDPRGTGCDTGVSG